MQTELSLFEPVSRLMHQLPHNALHFLSLVPFPKRCRLQPPQDYEAFYDVGPIWTQHTRFSCFAFLGQKSCCKTLASLELAKGQAGSDLQWLLCLLSAVYSVRSKVLEHREIPVPAKLHGTLNPCPSLRVLSGPYPHLKASGSACGGLSAPRFHNGFPHSSLTSAAFLRFWKQVLSLTSSHASHGLEVRPTKHKSG